MSLDERTRLGAYEITGLIGAGGMGEVYRARDTRLGRDVAIKTLPAALAADQARLARFEREAKLLATLNHPHIAAVHSLDEHEGTLYLAMELVEGETLEHKLLKAGALPVEDALRLALQIAEALEAAHGKGVIHRDLKPANIMVNTQGEVKVLDFGLAKAFGNEPTEASPAQSPALSLAMTQQGLILGTAGYMSPEQASGQSTDQRADIWAFGVVLYEMLTGLPLFRGESVPHILADVLKSEPDWTKLPRNLHPRLKLMLERCLTKKPRNRYHSIADARVDLEQALSDPAGATAAPGVSRSRPRWAAVLLMTAAAAAAGAVLAGASVWSLKPEPPLTAVAQRLSIVTPPNRPVVITGWPTRALTLSPDGRQLVFVARDTAAFRNQSRPSPFHLALRTLDTLAVRDLPGTVDARQPFFSPDGAWLGFFTGTGELKKVSLAGGAPITLAENINASEWAFGVWIPDGTIVFGTMDGVAGLRRVSAEGGAVEDVTMLGADRSHTHPAWVPESGAVLFTGYSAEGVRIEAIVLESGERRRVLDNARHPHVLHSGHLLFQRDETVLIARFDARELMLTGSAVPIIDAVQTDRAGNISVAELAVSHNGTFAYLPAVATADTLGFVGRGGVFDPLELPPGDYALPRVSRDGRSLAFIEARGEEAVVWVYDIERGTTSKLGADGKDMGLAWHPNGRSLAVAKLGVAGVEIVLRNLDGTEQVLVPPTPSAMMRNLAWSPDGTRLAYTVQTGSLHDIWIYSTEDAAAAPFLAGVASEYSPSFSPNGRWLAYESDESGRQQVYAQAFPQGRRFQVSIDGGTGPVWGPDGTELFYAGPVGDEFGLLAVTVTPEGEGLRFGRPEVLFTYQILDTTAESRYANSGNVGTGFDVAPDGERFATIRLNASQLGREVVLVQNWFEEVERLAPTD